VNNDQREIAEAILYLKHNPKQRGQLGRNARKGVEEFYNWKRVAKQTEDALEGLIARRAAR